MRSFTTLQINKILSENKKKPTRKNNIFYRGHQNTLNSDISIHLSFDECVEYSKCYNDIFYFIKNYLNITLYDFQKEWIDEFINNRFIIYCISREMQYTEIISAVYLYFLLFKKNNKILNVSYNLDSSIVYLNKVYEYYLKLPYFLKLGIKEKNSKKFLLNNGSCLYAQVYSKHRAIGFNVDILMYDMFSYVSTKIVEADCASTIPTVSAVKNSKVIIHSQPNGTNKFYELILNSERKQLDPLKNQYKTIKTYWWEIPLRNEEWKNNKIKELGNSKIFDIEYDLQFLK